MIPGSFAVGTKERRLAVVLAIALAVPMSSPVAQTKQMEPARVSPDQMLDPSALSSFYGGDTSRLRFGGPDEALLVRAKGKPFITVGEYNAWLGTYPLNVGTEDPILARHQALEQMITFKLIAAKARESGYADKLKSVGAAPDEKSLVLAYIRDQVSNTSSVSDAQAREYEARNRPRLAALDAPAIPPNLRVMVLKSSVRGEQLWDDVRRWMVQSEITYEEGSRSK